MIDILLKKHDKTDCIKPTDKKKCRDKIDGLKSVGFT